MYVTKRKFCIVCKAEGPDTTAYMSLPVNLMVDDDCDVEYHTIFNYVKNVDSGIDPVASNDWVLASKNHSPIVIKTIYEPQDFHRLLNDRTGLIDQFGVVPKVLSIEGTVDLMFLIQILQHGNQ